jgi:CheY-like chemotaxis protein
MAILTKLQPKTFIDSTIAGVAESANNKGTSLTVKLADNLPGSFYSDKTKLAQIITTLLDQAVHRTEKGAVIIHLKMADLPIQNKHNYITFCVEDTGCGVDLDSITQILDSEIPVGSWPQEFSNSDRAMGLRMASKLVSILGGKLRVECDNTAPMTRFSFTIAVKLEGGTGVIAQTCACADVAQAPLCPTEGTSFPVPEKTEMTAIRTLIVDDVSENRMLIDILLKKMGHKTSFAENGQEAVDLCKKEVFDVILMDIQMPVLNGFDATRKIRQEGLNTQSTIFAMTASGQKSDDFAALDAGCDDCLSKPLDIKKLERKLWRVSAQLKQLSDAESGKSIVSFLEGDPDYQKAIETFIENLPARVDEIKAAYEHGDAKTLASKVHALKGVGGFAGFPIFTEKAKLMEQSIHAHQVDKLQAQVEELVDLCLRTKLKDQSHL